MKKLITTSTVAAIALTGLAVAPATAASVAPITVDPWQSGNAVAECAAVTAETGVDYAYAWKFNSGEGKEQGAPNASETAEFEVDGVVHTNTITISNSDGTYFDWSATNGIGAVVVKGGDAANIFAYDPQVMSDTRLFSPPNNGSQTPEVSHLTFCWNLDEVEELPEFTEETAWAAGSAYNKKGNWATYTQYAAGATADIFAGQHTNVGTVTFSEAVDGKVTITVELTGGATFADKSDNLAIEGYTVAPSGNPSPGRFGFKSTESGTSASVTVDEANFYGIHLNVLVPVA